VKKVEIMGSELLAVGSRGKRLSMSAKFSFLKLGMQPNFEILIWMGGLYEKHAVS
jgi:hypothetical protein